MIRMSYPAVVYVRVVAVYNFVMADVYYFETHAKPTHLECSNYVKTFRYATSTVSCGVTCAGKSICHGFVYEPSTLNCSLIHLHDVPERHCQTWGSNDYYSLTVPVCDQYLVSGPGGVANGQLSESSSECDRVLQEQQNPKCLPAEMRYTSAWYARLGSRGRHSGSWVAGYKDLNQYVQVDFLQPKTVSAVVLSGRDPDHFVQYVTSFKVLYSDDCSVFHVIVNEDGTSVVLEGNRDGYNVTIRDLPVHVKARCFRINPLTWRGYDISLRFDLLGCH